MNVANLFLVSAILAIGFGLALLGVPGPFLHQYGVELGSAGAVEVARLFGSALIGFGVLSLSARSRPEAWPVAVITNLVADALGLVVAVHGTLTGATNAMGWSTVVIYAGLAAGFAYFRFAPQATATPATR